MEYKLQDLIDIQKIQGLLDSLHEAFLPSIGIIDREGTILARAGSQNVCLSFHRRDAVAAQECLESDRLAGRLASESSSTVTYHCPHGLIDSATPIVIDGTHMGSVFIGQFLLEPPDVETFRKRARTYGFDENTYLEAIARVPVISQADLERYTAFICTMTALLADMGLQHLRQFESEAELRASQQSYREMFDASWDALFVHDPVTGAILDVNQTMLDMFGYTREEVLRLTAHEISENVPPYSREEATRRIQAAVTEGPQLFEWRSRRKNGEVFWVEVSLRSCQLQGHHRILASARDITHRKEAQEKLATTQALLATAIEQSPAGILIADAPSLTVRVANPAAFTIRGSPTAQLTDISIAEHCKGWHITYPDGVTPYSAEDLPMGRAILKGEVSTNVETVVQTEQGEKRWLSINASPVRDANNRIIAGITVFHDITERKRAEQALVRSNHLLRAIIEASPLAVVSVDLDTNVVLWSPAAERIFGWTEQEIVGQRYPLAPDGRWDEVEAALAQAMQGASMSQQERLRRRKDGSLIPVSISTAAMRDEAGNVIGIMAIIADITKRKQAEEGLRFANTILRTQQETASDGILVVNEAARIISYNQRFVDMWELPPELMASGADEPVLQAVARKVANTPEFLARIEYLYQHRDVKTHEELALTNGATFERYTAPMWGIDGQYYGRVWYFHDITDRKRTEEALAESNRVLLTLMSNLPGMAYRCRNDRQWTHLLFRAIASNSHSDVAFSWEFGACSGCALRARWIT
jgi:PAS domain S-box-containing protein